MRLDVSGRLMVKSVHFLQSSTISVGEFLTKKFNETYCSQLRKELARANRLKDAGVAVWHGACICCLHGATTRT